VLIKDSHTLHVTLTSLIATLLILVVSSCDDPSGPVDVPVRGIEDTPRPNFEAETAALVLSGELIAPEALYQEMLRDLARVAAAFEQETGTAAPLFEPPWVPGELLMQISREAKRQVRSGTFTDLDDLNELYGLAEVDTTLLALGVLHLKFKGRLHPGQLSAIYERVPSVVWSEPNLTFVFSSDLFLRRLDPGTSFLYWRGSGDCPSGCINNEYWYLRLEQDIEYVGTYRPGEDPEPPWWEEAKLARCTKRRCKP